ncbi:MAG: hypothetical protein U0166_05205 [Acidobacteriota bacterium]
MGFDFDGSSIAPLPGFDVTVSTTSYGGHVGLGDVTGSGRETLLAGQGRDPAADATIRPYHYTGATLALLLSFNPFPGQTYGINAAGADLGY